MNGKPVEVPSLDSLVADPGKAAHLPPDIARTLLYGLAGVLPVLIAQSSRDAGKTELPVPERWLSLEEASEMFKVSPRWLRTHKDELPHSKPSHKVLLFPEQKLRSWFAAHKAH